MYTKFLSLDQEKQERIVNAALMEFALHGYEVASTIEIVKEAGISKGLLFHYFNNKKELFLFLYDYCFRMIKDEFVNGINLKEKDVLARCRQISLLKIELIHKHPQMFNFILVAYEKRSESIKEDLEIRNKDLLSLSYAKLFENIDETRFRRGVDVKRALHILAWSMEGFAAAQQQTMKTKDVKEIDYDAVLAEFDAYIDVFRTFFYRGEGE